MPTEWVIETSNLTKYYGKFCAIDHISATVTQSEILGFLGPNGAGKTTIVQSKALREMAHE